MGAGPAQRVALMAIQPPFAQAILAGTKRVEFRKRGLAPDIRTVLIYETAPTQMVVGQFTVGTCVTAQPEELWARFRRVGGITAEDFAAYYGDSATGVGLTVSTAARFPRPVGLSEFVPVPAVPQSFAYLDVEVLEQIRHLQPSESALPQALRAAAGLALAPARALVAAGRGL